LNITVILAKLEMTTLKQTASERNPYKSLKAMIDPRLTIDAL